jgi:hypothetical protein
VRSGCELVFDVLVDPARINVKGPPVSTPATPVFGATRQGQSELATPFQYKGATNASES